MKKYGMMCSGLLLCFSLSAQEVQLKELSTGKRTSMRGLSVVDDSVAWVSGSNGHVGKTIDGGKTWQWTQPLGYEKLDFRDIEAFNDQKALLLNAGSPAYLLLTEDGGKSWKEVYRNTDSLIFYDGMDFWNEQQGIAFGDPIDGKMPLLFTEDGGHHWRNISDQLKQPMKEGEAGFAASGTSIRTGPKGNVWIATGGTVSQIYHSADFGRNWRIYSCPILQGEPSTGPFSIAFYNERQGVVVGGNYLKDKENQNNVLLTFDGGKSWEKPQTPVSGYRSAVEFIDPGYVVATGSSGTDISADGGRNWKSVSSHNFNAVRKAKKGKLILMTGPRGEIYQLVLK